MHHHSRVLIIDDTEEIHNNIKILFQKQQVHQNIDQLDQKLFGTDSSESKKDDSEVIQFQLDSAFQGEEGLKMIKEAAAEGRPYSVAIIDMRMPPGWDGLQTIEQIRKVDQDLEIIICSAYSDYSWQDIADRLGVSEKYLFLSKPFEVAEIKQMIVALAQKWSLETRNRKYIVDLELANTRAQAAIKAKEDFLSVMSHELRTPLNVIIMTLEDLLESQAAGENLPLLKNADKSAKYLTHLIENIIYFIQLDSNTFKYQESAVDLSELIQNILSELEIDPLNHNIQVTTTIPANLPKILVDKRRLHVIITQLLDNAKKYTEKGEIKIEASLLDQGKAIEIKVSDTGMGMSKEEAISAFELFYQGEEINHHSRSGTGVGLSLCKKAVESLGGQIHCESEVSKGSTFVVQVPIGDIVRIISA